MGSISVVIPVYNSETTILTCINSVIAELTANPDEWELILVDDGSTDMSLDILQTYIDKSPYRENIELVCQCNKGAAAARNAGIKRATGEFIAFNDSDDIWLQGKQALQINYLNMNPDVAMIAGIYGQDNLYIFKKMKMLTEITIKDQVLKNYFSPPTTILRRAIINKSGLFNETMRHAEEGYFFNNVVYYGKSVIISQHVAAPIVQKKRWGDSGLSGNLIKMEQGELYNICSAYRHGYISIFRVVFAICFSLLKFFRRYMISNVKKLC